MSAVRSHVWPLAALALVLAGLIALTLVPYRGNVTALFHMDHLLANQHAMQQDFVILDVPSYDGAQYYQVARNMPLMLKRTQWETLRTKSPGAYAYQRFLLPALAYAVSFGRDAALPYAFLAINVLCLLGTCVLALRFLRKAWAPLYALALSLSPAALVALHFAIAEPLTLLLLTAFLTRYLTRGKLAAADAILLSLAVLTREVNILFVGVVFLDVLCRRRWRSLVLLILPIGSFLALHGLIYGIFTDVPFLWSTEKRGIPGYAILELLLGWRGYSAYTLSGIAMFVAFLLPVGAWLIADIWRRREADFLSLALLAFLALMFAMPDHIWGSITSIGRVITPVYPLSILALARRDTPVTRVLACAILGLGLAGGIALAVISHPFTFA